MAQEIIEALELRDLIAATEVGVDPHPTALEVAVLDFALRQYPEPIHGYGLRKDLEEKGLRPPRTNPGGLYRALGKIAEHGWLDRDEQPMLPQQGPSRIMYRVNGETVTTWLFGLRSLMKPTVNSSFGRGRR